LVTREKFVLLGIGFGPAIRERDVGGIVAVDMDGTEWRELEYTRQGSKYGYINYNKWPLFRSFYVKPFKKKLNFSLAKYNLF
jgi:hypothetical protein